MELEIAGQATACKRQKRNTLDDEDVTMLVGVEAEETLQTTETTCDSKTSLSKMCEKNDLSGNHTQFAETNEINTDKIAETATTSENNVAKRFASEDSCFLPSPQRTADANTVDNPTSFSGEKLGDTNPFMEYRLSAAAAREVISGSRSISAQLSPDSDDDVDAEGAGAEANAACGRTPSPALALDSDSNDGAVDGNSSNTDNVASIQTSPSFNHRNIPPTRSYRRINIELSMSSTSDSNSLITDNVNAAVDAERDDSEIDGDDAESAAENDNDFSPEEENSSNASDFFIPHYYSDGIDTDAESESNEEEAYEEVNLEEVESSVNEILRRSKPSYNWNLTAELMHRENNIVNRIGWRGGHTSANAFGRGYYSSLQAVERLALTSTLLRHRSCVNSLNFNRGGDLICSGSDDLLIVIWDWAKNKIRHCFKSGHTLNVFQTKFIDSTGCLDIISSSRDGQVRRAVIPPSGDCPKPTRLYSHSEAVHKIVVVPNTRYEIMSAGEDAAVKHFDLRTSESPTTLLRCCSSGRSEGRVRLFSISHHPYAPEFCISGCDDKLRVYDKRKCGKPVHEMTPAVLADTKITHITCAVYNHSGSEILASYSDAGIYLFDSRNYTSGEFLHCYEGHVNSRTIKGVNFFGPRSEYIVSGSDCGHVFFWDKNTESIVNFVKGDHSGIVNCLEPHPWAPVLATSGLDYNVKIWTPTFEPLEPKPDKLKETLLRNFQHNMSGPRDFDINQFHYFIRQFLQGNPSDYERPRRNRERADPESVDEHRQQPENNTNSSSQSANSQRTSGTENARANIVGRHRDGNSSDGTDDDPNLETLHCRTQ
ncbi:DDB1- and CUL4-associated factor 8 [Scaptodrosophila lebanonensis]|uniref:DDB1- and CUL4-associated factor 8 n=1 Tax=Drosophila lebanonensis TaxID=7225 RepID=A0A6J2TUG6_DROLE|nr:DDB1- and CUL4-associated factor 8 [Scaptodrosophila lebanonensis]